MYAQFKNVGVGEKFVCGGTVYRKINSRMGRIEMPGETYHGKKFYFGWTELCRVIADDKIA